MLLYLVLFILLQYKGINFILFKLFIYYKVLYIIIKYLYVFQFIELSSFIFRSFI